MTEYANRTVKRKLSAADKARAGEDLLRALRMKEQLERDKKAKAQEFKSKLTDADALIGRLTNALEDGTEEVTIKCEVVPDERLGVMRYVDPDTGKTVDERPLTADERQTSLDLGGGTGLKGDFDGADPESFAAKAAAAAKAAEESEDEEPEPGDED